MELMEPCLYEQGMVQRVVAVLPENGFSWLETAGDQAGRTDDSFPLGFVGVKKILNRKRKRAKIFV